MLGEVSVAFGNKEKKKRFVGMASGKTGSGSIIEGDGGLCCRELFSVLPVHLLCSIWPFFLLLF
jgi:hypothetical protein